MEAVNRETRTSVHFSISFVLAAAWTPDKAKTIDFQKALLDNGLDFAQTNIGAGLSTMLRREPSNLQIKLQALGPQVMNMQIISAGPGYNLDMFCHESSAATDAYQQTWVMPQYQIIRVTAKIQHLYSCRVHAFKYLWESRLGQSGEDFGCLGKRPVAGGGLRLVMPPHAVEGEEPRSIEIRLESVLPEPKKILVDTTFMWPQPRLLKNGEKFDPAGRLKSLEEYATNEVWDFLTYGKNQDS